jgi:hypothetical protein
VTAAPGSSPSSPVAWRVPLDSLSGDGAVALARRGFPATRELRGQPLDVEAAMSEPETDDRALTLFVAPSGAATPFDLLRKLEAFVLADERPGLPRIDMTLRTRFVACGRRALAVAPEGAAGEAVEALIHFALAVDDCQRVRLETEALWGELASLVPLTHSVSADDLRRQAAVDAATLRAAAVRMAYLELDRRLSGFDAAMSPPVRRQWSELCLQSELLTLLRAHEDMIEMVVETCEAANERLTEFRYFRSEWILEVLIVIALAIDLAAQVFLP